MEQVTLSSLPSGAFICGSQALLLQNNNQNLNLSACLNGDIIQQALSGINTQIPCMPDMNSQIINIEQNSLILDNEVDDEDTVVQLSINDDFPLHLLNSSRTDDSIFNIDNQSILLEDVLNSANDKSDSLDSLNNFLQLSPVNESNDIQDISLPSVKGNFTYAYQLTNGMKLSQLSPNTPANIPVTTSNGFTNITPILTSTSVDVSKPVSGNQNASKYVILRGVNIKPRLVLNLNKPNQEVAKNGTQKVQKIPVNGMSVKNKNPRNIAPQKIALPPLKKPKLIEATLKNPLVKSPLNQEIKSKSASVWLKSLLKSKSTDTLKRNNGSTTNSPVQQVISNDTRVEDQEKLLSNLILQHNVANTFLPKSSESPVQQVITNDTRVEGQEKLLSNLILQHNVANTFLPKSSESAIKNNFLNDSGLIPQGKLLSTPKLKVTKATETHPEPNGRCTEDQLKKIQTAFQNGELNLDKNNASSVIYDEEAKIVCKLLYPEEFTQNDNQEKEEAKKNGKKRTKRLGRPPLEKQTDDMSPAAKKASKEVQASKEGHASKEVLPKEPPRTRSGRLSRPPRYMTNDFKKPSIDQSDISSEEIETDEKAIVETKPIIIDVPVEEKVTWYRCPTCGRMYCGEERILLHFSTFPHHGDPKDIDTMKSEMKMCKCATCGKNYSGHLMLRHLAKYPEHDPKNYMRTMKRNSYSTIKKLCGKGKKQKNMKPGPLKEILTSYTDDVLIEAVKERISRIISPWDFLVERQPTGDGAVRGLLSDLADILKALPSDILEATDSSNPNAIYINDDRLCQMLNISPGSYLTNDSAIKPAKQEKPPLPSKEDDKLVQALKMSSVSFLSNDCSTEPSQLEDPPPTTVSTEVWPLSTVAVMSPAEIVASNQSVTTNQILASDQAISCTSQVIPTNQVLSTGQIISTNQVLSTNPVLTSNEVLPTTQVISTSQMMLTNQVLPTNQVLSTRQVLSPPPVMSQNAMMSPPHDEDNIFGKDNPLDLDKKEPPDLCDILLDKSSLDTVDEILNDRLNELMPLDVPSLSESQALARSIFSTNSLELHGVSGSTEDLLKSLENLAPELPSVSEPADFDFAVLSTDFGSDR